MAALHGAALYKLNRQCICKYQGRIYNIVSSLHWKCSTAATNQANSRIAALPIPGKKMNHHRHRNNSDTKPSIIGPWQHRSVTLHDQCYQLPEMIVARIESVTNAKIEILSSTHPQSASSHQMSAQNEIEIHGADPVDFSSFAPSSYHQVTITGDANAVDHAMAVYIHYFQKAMPLVLGTTIPDDVLDAMGKECGCFIQRQNDKMYRVFPTTLDGAKHSDTDRMLDILAIIRSSVHRIDIPAPWHQHGGWMQALYRYLERRAIANELRFKSGGYFWCQWTPRNDSNHSEFESNEISESIESMDSIEFLDDDLSTDGGSIWIYQRTDNKSTVDLKSTLKDYIDHFVNRWHCLSMSSKKRPILSAKRGALWKYLQKTAREQLKVHCVLSDHSILWRNIVNDSGDSNASKVAVPDFEGLVSRILEDVVHREINVELTEQRRREVHALCAEWDLIYLLPDDESYISYHLGMGHAKRAKLVDAELRRLIDPELEPQQNAVEQRPKSDQIVRIENSEKFHVVIRMLQFLEETQPELIRDMKAMRELDEIDNDHDGERLYFAVRPKQRSIEFTMEGTPKQMDSEADSEGNADSPTLPHWTESISTIFERINEVQSVSVPLPMLLLLRANRGQFGVDLEERFNVFLSAPPIRDIAHILQRHKQQRRFVARRGSDSGDAAIIADRVAAKIYFWSTAGVDTEHRLERYLEDLVYRRIDVPIPIDLLYRASNHKVLNAAEAADCLVAKHCLIAMVNHPTKAVSDSNRALKFFNPSPSEHRYWLFATHRDAERLHQCHRDIMDMVRQCPFIDLKEMGPLLGFLETVPAMMAQRRSSGKKEMRWYLHRESAKLFCFEHSDANSVGLFREDLYREMDRLWTRHCLSISGKKYGDTVLFMVQSNFKRIQNVVQQNAVKTKKRRKSGFLWYSTTYDALHIFCENDHVLQTVESDVIADIDRNSKVLFWSEFGVEYEEYCKSDALQQGLRALMQQTETSYAIRGQRPECPTMAITNYDAAKLEAAHTQLMAIFARQPSATTQEASSHEGQTTFDQHHAQTSQYIDDSPSSAPRLIPKPLILS